VSKKDFKKKITLQKSLGGSRRKIRRKNDQIKLFSSTLFQKRREIFQLGRKGIVKEKKSERRAPFLFFEKGVPRKEG